MFWINIADKFKMFIVYALSTVDLKIKFFNYYTAFYRHFNTFAATDALARQHGATSHAGDALGRQSSMISTSGVPS